MLIKPKDILVQILSVTSPTLEKYKKTTEKKEKYLLNIRKGSILRIQSIVIVHQ